MYSRSEIVQIHYARIALEHDEIRLLDVHHLTLFGCVLEATERGRDVRRWEKFEINEKKYVCHIRVR